MRINDLSPGISLLEVPGEGYEVTYRGRRLTAPSQPRLAAEKRAARFSILPKSIVFLPSPLLFYGVSTLLRGLPEDCLILFGEGNGELRRLSEQAFPREIRQDPRVHPGILGSMEELVQFLEVSPLQNFRRIQTISLTGGYALEARTYRGWEDAIRDALRRYWRNRAVLSVLGRMWIENLITNIPQLVRGKNLGDFATDKPIIVAGAGESLEYALPFLGENRESFLLLAADTAIPILLEGGLKPDLGVVVEGQHANLGDFFHPAALDIPCLFDLTSHPGLIRKHRGPRGFFLSRFTQICLWEQMESRGILPPLLPPLGSVGIAAVYLARLLTGNHILLTGLDFCFQPGKPHSRGAPLHRARLGKISRMTPLICFDHGFSPPLSRHLDRRGRAVISSPNLLDYRELLISLGDSPRIWDMGTCSLPSPLTVPENPWELLNNPSAMEGEIFPSDSSPGKRAIEDFFGRLAGDMEGIVNWGYQWLTGRRDDNTKAKIHGLLEKNDFLYAPFPDAPSSSGLKEAFLKRILVQAGRIQDKIKQALAAQE